MLLIYGDAIIDFLPTAMPVPGQASGLSPYLPVAGGSCFNVALGLGRLGVPTGFMGGLSTDFFGQFLAQRLTEAGVSLNYASRLPEGSTLAFVELSGQEPQYAFFDRETAMRRWRRAEAPMLTPDIDLLHIGSVPLIADPVADEAEALFREQQGQRLLSIDPNCRPSLVEDPTRYHARMQRLLSLADIIKLSLADLAYLLPGVPPEAAARRWIEEDGATLVVLTQGAEGVTGFTAQGKVHCPARRVAVIDTVGAGDSLTAGLFWQLHKAGFLTRDRLGTLPLTALEAALAAAVQVAAVTCGRLGADMPWLPELTEPVDG
ncbi:carbohydrate kinase [Acidisoma cellulosilytica]|uniref:Carbohydrate kinase n=1 Tax=Acidisoma cellulosilyticum TaxID=2802395 RepID=A0A963Z5S6_9PROT|nr:carbohydrate kinase [Acidisoma cellulosilyticum]MCB8882372.1 carbohydrate kinase [Acidisoma cellulosilyticum]